MKFWFFIQTNKFEDISPDIGLKSLQLQFFIPNFLIGALGFVRNNSQRSEKFNRLKKVIQIFHQKIKITNKTPFLFNDN